MVNLSSTCDTNETVHKVRMASTGSTSDSSRKRPVEVGTTDAVEEKRARERKRILRNRELARASNERRKGRIKAMETELQETRKTVANLEESIRSLETENVDLMTMLEHKSTVL